MPTIPANYPEGCNPEQIKTAIREMQNELARTDYQINLVLKFSPLINLGQFELERRQNEAVVRQSKILGYISLGIALVALGISFLNALDSSNWERNQIAVLEQIEKNTEISKTLEQNTTYLQEINKQLGKEITCVLKSGDVKVGQGASNK